jgi:hypothetical protein
MGGEKGRGEAHDNIYAEHAVCDFGGQVLEVGGVVGY